MNDIQMMIFGGVLEQQMSPPFTFMVKVKDFMIQDTMKHPANQKNMSRFPSLLLKVGG